MELTGTATDPIGLSDTDVKSISASGSSVRTIKSSFFKNRANWGNAITEDQHGPQADPDVYVEATPQNLGFVAEVQRDCRTTGMRFYKMPSSSGAFTVGCWNSTGVLLASKVVNLTTSDDGWITVEFDAPVNLAEGETYYWGYNYPLNDNAWAWSAFAWNAQDNYVYPLWVPGYSVSGSGTKSGGSWRKSGAFGVSTASNERQPHNYYVDPMVEWDVDYPTYTSGSDYWDQFPNGRPRKLFPIGIYWADPPFIAQYAALGINTYWAGDVSDAYRDPIVAADMDWYPTLHGNDMSAPRRVQEDSALAAVVRGYMLTDEPEANLPYNSPATLRTWRNNCRRIDSTRPVNLNMSRKVMENQGFTMQPPGQSMKKNNEDWREYMALADWGSMDAYGIAQSEPFTYTGSGFNRYGIWFYPMQIRRMRDEITDRRMPISGVVETTSAFPNSPTPQQVQRTVWSMLIAGAKGIEYFDHRFSGPAVTQDFAAMLHGDPAMKNTVQALNAQMISLAPALLADDAGYITGYTSTGTMTKVRGGYAAGAKVPMHYSSRVVGGTTYFFVQAIRDGATTATIKVPGFQNAVLTVIGEGRTVTVNGVGEFTDNFTNGDYEYHLYSTTASPTFVAPDNTGAPVVSGTPTTGQTLTVSSGTWTGVPAPTFTYQWQRNGSNISGATGVTYPLTGADEGTTVRCVVVGTNSEGSDTATSNEVVVGTPTGSSYEALILSDNPVAYYRLTDLSDASDNGHDLTNVLGVTGTTGIINDEADGAMHWDASGNALLRALDAPELRLSGAGGYSVELWVKPAVVAGFIMISKLGDFSFNMSPSVFRWSPNGASGWYTWVDSTTPPISGNKYHVVGTWDLATKVGKIYVNGVLETTVDASTYGYAPTTSGWGALTLGANPELGGTGYATGDMDEVAIYDFALSSTQVAAHYAEGSA